MLNNPDNHIPSMGKAADTAGCTEIKVQSGEFCLHIADELNSPEIVEQLANIHELTGGPDAVTLASGRNRVVRTRLDGYNGEIVIKEFGRPGILKQMVDFRRGSKALRTWRNIRFLQLHGIGTPEPLACIENTGRCGLCRAAWLVTRYQPGMVSFADELGRLLRDDPQCWKIMNLCQTVAGLVSSMHAAGFIHRDLGNQNIILQPAGDGEWQHPMILDLNRGRIVNTATARLRARDISRIYLPSDFLRVFIEMLGGDQPPSRELLRYEMYYRRCYALHSKTRPLRHPLRAWRQRGEAVLYPPEKEMWVWDERSGQPVCPLKSKDRRSYYSINRAVEPVLRTLPLLPRGIPLYRKIRDEAFSNAVACDGMAGLSVEPVAERWSHEREWLASLNHRLPVMIRLYRHENSTRRQFRYDAVNELARGGYPVSVTLVQDRSSVREPELWRTFVNEALGAVGQVVEYVQPGHCINRVKWGFWGFEEYGRWMQATVEALQNWPDLHLIGPGAIDFEYPLAAAALARLPQSRHYSALAHLLYVDRRGAPENRQGRFDLVDKCAMLQTLARLSPRCENRVFITEVNWPLKGSGVYSPVGAPYVSPGDRQNDPSVNEATYAAYMLRYFLMAGACGFVERIYWWRLAAHGYGLVDDLPEEDYAGRWRPRPAYDALRTWLEMTKGATIEPDRTVCNCAPGIRRFVIHRPRGGDVVLAYNSGTNAVPFPSEWLGRTIMAGTGGDKKTAGSSDTIGMLPVYVFQ